MSNIEPFISFLASSYIHTKGETADAFELIEQALIDKILAFDFQNQIQPILP